MREIRISEIDVHKSLAKAEKIANRGKKKGLEGGYKVSVQSRSEVINGVELEYSVLVIEGEPVKFNGWEFIGVAQFIENQVILKGFGGNEVQASEVKAGYCDHCKVSRHRGQVIFVKNQEGKLSQVGSTCVKDFLGWDFFASALVTEEDFVKEFSGNFSSYSGVDIGSIVALSVTAVKKLGYAKSGSALSTKDLVWGYALQYNDGIKKWKELVGEDSTQEDISQAKEIIDWAKNFEGDTTYAQNLRAVANLKFINASVVGIAVSAVKVFQGATAPKPEQVEFKKEQFAVTGEKVEIDVTVSGVHGFEGAYGWTTIYTFVSGDYQFKWFSSGGASLVVGETTKIKGTVKGCEEYKDVFSTLLTRCKVLQKVA